MVPDCLLVCEFRAVELDLNLCPVQLDISGDPEGNRISFPSLPGDPFGDYLFKLDAGVPLLIVEDFFTTEERGPFDQFRTLRNPGLDPDFGKPALALCGLLDLEEPGEFFEGHPGHHVDQMVENETKPVFSGGGVGVVGVDQQVHHFGVPPSSVFGKIIPHIGPVVNNFFKSSLTFFDFAPRVRRP